MGCSTSKHEGDEPLILCKGRVRFIKQAIDSRYALSAAQLSYLQSLRNVGMALRQFAESETLIESSLSTSEPEKSPSHSSYASPSPSQIVQHATSPVHSTSPLSPRLSDMSYMRATTSSPLKFMVDSSSNNHFVEEESLTFPLPPPPPPPDIGLSWDFFDPIDAMGNAGFSNGESGINQTFSRLVGLRHLKEEGVVPSVDEEGRPLHTNKDPVRAKVNSNGNFCNGKMMGNSHSVNGKSESSCVNGSAEALAIMASTELRRSKREKSEMVKELCTKTEDASEFITHRAKDFLSSTRDIEHRFNRASESGHEVSRMLETNKIRLSICSETIGKSSGFQFSSAFHLVCCNAKNVADHDEAKHVSRVITWNRSISSRSSSSRNPLTSASKEDGGESSSDFIEEFSMISGSHSSTLDRLYAWERKLYDEVKASESIRKGYDRKCAQLRHQFARDLKVQVIDRTRATVKDLHSRVRVAIQAVDSISRRIEKLRDEELQPQLVELIQGLIRMWKAMLECHHSQYITISLAYQVKSSAATQQTESYKHAITHLRNEIECLASSFATWMDAEKSYIEALNAWLQKCILPAQGRSWGRKVPFCPRRALAPPIFVLSRDWLASVNSLPLEEVSSSIKGLVSDLQEFYEQYREVKQGSKSRDGEIKDSTEPMQEGSKEEEKCEQKERKEEDKCERSDLGILQTRLTRMFDQLTKFSEASVKAYENVKQGSDVARDAYINGGYR